MHFDALSGLIFLLAAMIGVWLYLEIAQVLAR
jgi:hypothetical protein